MPIAKIQGNDNPADLMTKHMSASLALHHLHRLGLDFAQGRAKVAAKLHLLAGGGSSIRALRGERAP